MCGDSAIRGAIRHQITWPCGLHGLQEPAIFLEGSPGYYRRFGFEAAGSAGFRRPSLRIPEPAFQVRTFASYEPWMTGTLVYPEAFWELDCVGLR